MKKRYTIKHISESVIEVKLSFWTMIAYKHCVAALKEISETHIVTSVKSCGTPYFNYIYLVTVKEKV